MCDFTIWYMLKIVATDSPFSRRYFHTYIARNWPTEIMYIQYYGRYDIKALAIHPFTAQFCSGLWARKPCIQLLSVMNGGLSMIQAESEWTEFQMVVKIERKSSQCFIWFIIFYYWNWTDKKKDCSQWTKPIHYLLAGRPARSEWILVTRKELWNKLHMLCWIQHIRTNDHSNQ